MNATAQNENNDFIEILLASFESRVKKIEDVFNTSEAVKDSSFALMNDLLVSLEAFREERDHQNSKLRENLAKNGSLRKNDYDILMKEVFNHLDEKEKEAKIQFSQYIEDQKAMVHFLRQGILEIKNPEPRLMTEKIEEFKMELEHILKDQHTRKEVTVGKFLEFKRIHQNIMEHFTKMLDQDAHVLSKDIKKVKKHLLEELVGQ